MSFTSLLGARLLTGFLRKEGLIKWPICRNQPYYSWFSSWIIQSCWIYTSRSISANLVRLSYWKLPKNFQNLTQSNKKKCAHALNNNPTPTNARMTGRSQDVTARVKERRNRQFTFNPLPTGLQYLNSNPISSVLCGKNNVLLAHTLNACRYGFLLKRWCLTSLIAWLN